MKNIFKLLFLAFAFVSVDMVAQHSVAREWNELHLNAIRNDFARPTVTARNLYHVTSGMYDAWAAYDDVSRPHFLGQTVNGFSITYNGVTMPTDPVELEEAKEMAVSYAAYRILSHRYSNLPSTNEIAVLASFDNLMTELGYSTDVNSVDYVNDGPAALGNYIAEQIIEYGYADGANEQGGYDNLYYETVNEPMITQFDGNPDISDPNRWQPLTLIVAIDQAGNPLPINTPDFLSPEWGNVSPFSLTDEDKTLHYRDENIYQVYCDPGAPEYIDSTTPESGLTDEYKWNHAMVAVWSSLLAHDNGVMIDASPNNIGNATSYPETYSIAEMEQFYNYYDGLDASQGYTVNPTTGMPYESQMVPLGDYGRVLAEFWADGPDSETPPGHWFTILNYVSDHPLAEKKWQGEGDALDDLQWDIKTYFALGGAMHDCAVAAWGIKGWYDYIRPISAIRYMGDQGQSSDATLPHYSPSGLPLIPDYIELVDSEDPLVGVSQENLNKIKVKAWKGPDFLDQLNLQGNIIDGVQDSTIAGVDWVLSENWWPYQRPSFVSPPFAGYISGHSTFSRAAAQVLESATGDEYFPGGMGVFEAPQNDFLVFETGPSVGLELQWAKYKDASDQCSLSRIFGGIHPPIDDIPGRKIGKKIGDRVFNLVDSLSSLDIPRVQYVTSNLDLINDAAVGTDLVITAVFNRDMDGAIMPALAFYDDLSGSLTEVSAVWTAANTFQWEFTTMDDNFDIENVILTISDAQGLGGVAQEEYYKEELFSIDTENPTISSANFDNTVNESIEGEIVNLILTFNENISSGTPVYTWVNDDPTINTLTIEEVITGWVSGSQYEVPYYVSDADEELDAIQLEVSGVTDDAGNPMVISTFDLGSIVDTAVPELVGVTINQGAFLQNNVGTESMIISATYNDQMGDDPVPVLEFSSELLAGSLVLNTDASGINGTSYDFVYDIIDEDLEVENVSVTITGLTDNGGNPGPDGDGVDLFSLDTDEPEIESLDQSVILITENETGTQLTYSFTFDQPMNETLDPLLDITPSLPSSLTFNDVLSVWTSEDSYSAVFDITDENEEETFSLNIISAEDLSGNIMLPEELTNSLEVENKAPSAFATANLYNVTSQNEGTSGFEVFVLFDEALNTDVIPVLTFSDEDPGTSLLPNESASGWFGTAYKFSFDVAEELTPLAYIDISLSTAEDLAGNQMVDLNLIDYFSIQLDTFLVVEELSFNKIKVFPNPITSGLPFTVELENISNYDIVIYDQLGREIEVSTEITSSNKLEVSTLGLSSGKYFIKLRGEDSESVMRIDILR